MTLKAYKISCRNDDHGEDIQFAERAKDLRGFGTERCDCGYIERSVRRAPEFDDCAPGPVTSRQKLERDWFICCGYCDCPCYGDEDIVVAGDYVFCDDDCFTKDLESVRKWINEGGVHESFIRHRDTLENHLASRLTVTCNR